MYSGLGGSEGGEERDAAGEAIAQRLRELRNEARPPFDWSELRRRMQTKSAQGYERWSVIRSPTKAWGRSALALILGAVVIGGAVLVMNRIDRVGSAGIRPNSPPAQFANSGEQLAGAREPAAVLARADSAERWLAERPDDAALVRVSTHLAIANLENRLASMDDLLNLQRLQHAHPSRLHALQLQRAQLVDSLAQVRYAEMLVEETP